MDAIGVADRDTLAGVVRMHSAAKGAGLRPLIGCRLVPVDAPELLAYPSDRDGYGRLSRLLSLGKMRSRQGRVRPAAERDRAACRGDRLHRHAGRGSRCVRGGASGAGRGACPGCAMSRRRIFIAATIWRGSSGSTGMAKAPRPEHPGDQRRPLSRGRAPPAAGRDDLHPREGDAGRGGLSAQPQCRAASEIAGRDDRLVRALAPCHRRDARLLPTRSTFSLDELRYEYPEETCPGRTHPAAASGASHLGRGVAALAAGCRQGAQDSSGTSSR